MYRILFFCLLFISFVTHGQSIEELYQRGNHAEIVRKAAVAKTLSGPEAYMVGCAYFQIGQDDLAVTYLDMALAKGVQTGPVYFKKGLALRFAKKYAEALDAFDAAIQIEPNDAEYKAEKGLVYYQSGQNDTALSYFQQLQALPEPAPTVLYMVPHLLHIRQQFSLALAGFYSAAAAIPAKNPRYLETLMDIGKLEYTFTGDYRKSAAAYTRAMQLFPEESALYSKLMKAHNAAGQPQRADSVFAVLQRYYKLGKLPSDMTKSGMIAVAEYHWNKQLVTAHRSLDEPDKLLDVAYRVFLVTPAGDKVERRFTVERTQKMGNGPDFLLCEYDRQSGGHRTYPYGWQSANMSIAAIYEGVKLVLNGKMTPSATSNFSK